MPAPLVIAAGISAAAQLASMFGQNAMNRGSARWELEQNRKANDLAYQRELQLLQYQLDWNSPVNQMKRFKEAGLNPNLVYGQGTPGNMQNAPQVPRQAPARGPQLNFNVPDFYNTLQDMRLKAAQTDLLTTKKDESNVKQDLMRVQTEVSKANPYLAPGYVDALVTNMKSIAELKKQEAGFKLEEITGTLKDGTEYYAPTSRGYIMMEKQMDQLFQKYQLGEKDLKIKSEIIQSKNFENDLKQIQRDWMKSGDITPQHIYQAIFMLLQQLTPRLK